MQNRIIGIDFGAKRVGVAVSDPTGAMALPVDTWRNGPKLAEKLVELSKHYETKTVVMGESKDYAGEPNAISADIEAFKKTLEKMGMDVRMEPEFMTSVQAERLQGKNGKSDASAAAIILQSYLDKNNNGI